MFAVITVPQSQIPDRKTMIAMVKEISVMDVRTIPIRINRIATVMENRTPVIIARLLPTRIRQLQTMMVEGGSSGGFNSMKKLLPATSTAVPARLTDTRNAGRGRGRPRGAGRWGGDN